MAQEKVGFWLWEHHPDEELHPHVLGACCCCLLVFMLAPAQAGFWLRFPSCLEL